MSDYLSGLGTPNLEALNNADPTDLEDASNVGPAIRQIKSILYNFLLVSFNTQTGQLKDATVIGDTVGNEEIRGSTANTAGTAQEIALGTISTPDLRDEAVGTAKLANLAVTAAKIANGTITATQIANLAITTALINDLAVTAAKIANGTITDVQLADLCVTTNKLAALAVTGAKIADNTIGVDKINLSPTAGQILVGQTGSPKFALKTPGGAVTMDADGVFSLVGSLSIAQAYVRERAAKGTDGGASVTGVDLTAAALTGIRGGSVAWLATGNLSSTISSVPDGTLTLARAGTYVLEIKVPGFGVGLHKMALQRYNSAGTLMETIYGTNEYAPPGAMTASTLRCVITVTAGDKIRVRHYTELARANGFGVATNATATTEEVYTTISMLQV